MAEQFIKIHRDEGDEAAAMFPFLHQKLGQGLWDKGTEEGNRNEGERVHFLLM